MDSLVLQEYPRNDGDSVLYWGGLTMFMRNINHISLEERAEQELVMAGKASCIEAKIIHLNLAALYAAQSEAALSKKSPRA